jgi:hypothetical protein
MCVRYEIFANRRGSLGDGANHSDEDVNYEDMCYHLIQVVTLKRCISQRKVRPALATEHWHHLILVTLVCKSTLNKLFKMKLRFSQQRIWKLK